MKNDSERTGTPAVAVQRIVRRLLAMVVAIIFTPTLVVAGFMLGYPIVCAWNGSGDAGADWAENYWDGWGHILKIIGGQDA